MGNFQEIKKEFFSRFGFIEEEKNKKEELESFFVRLENVFNLNAHLFDDNAKLIKISAFSGKDIIKKFGSLAQYMNYGSMQCPHFFNKNSFLN